MQHDIAHCQGTFCPKRSTCYRYLAWLEAVECKFGFITCIKPQADCKMYWNINKHQNNENEAL